MKQYDRASEDEHIFLAIYCVELKNEGRTDEVTKPLASVGDLSLQTIIPLVMSLKVR